MRRLVAVGKIRSKFHTVEVTYASGEQAWDDQPDPNASIDDDQIRKLALETEDA